MRGLPFSNLLADHCNKEVSLDERSVLRSPTVLFHLRALLLGLAFVALWASLRGLKLSCLQRLEGNTFKFPSCGAYSF